MKTFLAIIVLPLCLSACLLSPGTNTGNPGLIGNPNAGTEQPPSIYFLAVQICGKISTCYARSSVTRCYFQIMSLNGYTSELGATAATYDTMSEIGENVANGTLPTNLTNYQYCHQALESLSCADSLVQNAYTPSTPLDYSTTNILFRVSSTCQQIY